MAAGKRKKEGKPVYFTWNERNLFLASSSGYLRLLKALSVGKCTNPGKYGKRIGVVSCNINPGEM